MATKTSSKFDHITSKVVLHSGSPAVYQLKPKKENIGTLKKMTLGEKNPNKTNKTILLVGETGTGKSTLINALVNYAMGVKWEDDVWFKIVDEEERRQLQSQTSDVIVYQIFGFENKTLPYSLTIIDTPGYGSTEGIEEDDAVSERLLDWFSSNNGVHEINVVGLVLKASENRLSDRLSYIFDSVLSLFGKDMEENIVALITYSDGVTPEDALKALEASNINFAKDEKNQSVHFLFNNRQTINRTENTEALEYANKISTKGMKEFTGFLEKTAPQKLKITVDVLNERVRLKACMQNLKERVELIELKQTEINQILQSTVEVDVPYKVKVDVSERRWWAFWLNYGGAVCCDKCEENCHYPCTLAWYPKDCEVMKDHRCTVCKGRCHESYHVKEKKKYVTRTKKVQIPVQEVIKKYGQGKTDKKSAVKNLEMEKEKLQKEKDLLLEEAFQHVRKLEQIALNADSASTYIYLDFLIEKMEEKGDKEKVQKLEEMKSRLDKDNRLKAAFQYGLGRIAAAGKSAGKAVGKTVGLVKK